MKLEHQFRTLEIGKPDSKERTVTLSFSSEEPYERYFGIEILDHSLGAIDFSRLKNGAPLLFNHKRDEVIGVVESAGIEDGRGVAVVRFGNSAKAQEVLRDVEDGILKNVSVGYEIQEMRLESERDGIETHRVTRWFPYEISIVSIPADNTVGIGREAQMEEKEIKITGEDMENKKTQESTVDVAQLQKEAREKEVHRIKEIISLGEKLNKKAMAQKAIDDGTDLDVFRAAILGEITLRENEIKTDSSEIGMSKREIKSYSFTKALAAAITGDWSKAGLEKEASLAVEKHLGVQSRGFYVPHDVLKREITTTGNAANLVDTTYMPQSFIDLLRDKLIISKLGGTTLTGLKGNIAIPKQTGTLSAYWIDEGEDTTESELSIGMMNLSPKTVSGATAYTRQMLLQSNPSIEALVMKDLAFNIAKAIDLAAISGNGTKEPVGILNQTGINAIDTSGGLSWEKVVEFESVIASQNADVSNMHFIANATIAGKLKTTQKESGTGNYLLEKGEVNGYKFHATNQVADNTLIFGDFSQIITALWGGLDIMIDPYTKGASGGTVIRAFQSLDIGLRYPQSFSATTNIG